MGNRILFVGGNFDLNGGKRSKIVDLFSKNLPNVTLYNGGNYNELEKIIQKVKDYDIVLWWANVSNDLNKIRNVKEINNKVMLVSSKRNNGEYEFQELIHKSLAIKANLTVEFSNKDGYYNMRLFDPLGNIWYDGVNINECSYALLDRLNFIKNVTRKPTIKSEENYDNLKQIISNKTDFLNIVKDYAYKFADIMNLSNYIYRFLGNASFRCQRGFPSFRDKDYIFVSKRNVNKEFISIDDFVPVYLKDNKVYYSSCNKPSVDTYIQVNLYKILKNINYMIHSHCYINNAPFTKCAIPCGALEEVDEILNLIKDKYNGDYDRDFYLINLLGHGSIMMSSDVSKLKNMDIVSRTIPENQYDKVLIRKK